MSPNRYRRMISYHRYSSICRINKITKQELLFEDNKYILRIAELEAKNIVLETKLKAITENYLELYERFEYAPKDRRRNYRRVPEKPTINS